MNKAAKTQIEQEYKTLFESIFNKGVWVSWSKHRYQLTLTEIRIPKQTDIYNLPEKREIDTKLKTPVVLQFVFSSGATFDIIYEDITSKSITTRGISLVIGATKLTFEL
jgi:hypothetical protein